MGIGDWGLGIGDWGLGVWANPQSPKDILYLQFNILIKIENIYYKVNQIIINIK